MASASIAVISGDGIGPDVIDQAIRVIDVALQQGGAAFTWNRLPWSSAYYKKTGHIVPDDGWDTLRKHDAILFGAIGSPDVPDTVTVHGLLPSLLRRKFDLYVNLRPAYLFAGVQSPLRDKLPGSIDMLVYRENTEGEYAPIGGRLYAGTPHETALQTSVFTRRGCERILRAGFEAARKRPRKKLTSITKSNAQVHTLGLWDEVYRDVAKDYPDVQSHSLLVDAAAMDLVRKPEVFDVIVASNLFGDILTDLGAAIITGSAGPAPRQHQPGARLSEHVRAGARFRARHRRQGDRQPAGRHPVREADAGPTWGTPRAAAAMQNAVARVLKEAKVCTPDLGGKATTVEMADAVIAALGENHRRGQSSHRRVRAMCGRFVRAKASETYGDLFGVRNVPDFTASYNVAPTQPVLAARIQDDAKTCVVLLGSHSVLGQGQESELHQRPRRYAVRQAGLSRCREAPALPHLRGWLLRMEGDGDQDEAALLFSHGRRQTLCLCRHLGDMEWRKRADRIVFDHHDGRERAFGHDPRSHAGDTARQ